MEKWTSLRNGGRGVGGGKGECVFAGWMTQELLGDGVDTSGGAAGVFERSGGTESDGVCKCTNRWCCRMM